MEMAPQLGYDLFHPIMENLPLAVLLIDHNYGFIYCNSLFLSISGLSYSQLGGINWAQFLPPSRQQMLFQELSEIKHGREKYPDVNNSSPEWSINHCNSEKLGALYLLTFTQQGQAVYSPFSPEQNASPSMMDASLLHINQSEETFDRLSLEKINHELRAANLLKDKILSVVAHDIRTPLASLQSLTTAFLDTGLNNEDKTTLRIGLLKQLASVTDLTENILLWATNSFTKAKSDIKETIRIIDIIEINQLVLDHLALAKNIIINYNIPADLRIHVNRDQISMVIRNLISNAIKYTLPAGQIFITASLLNSHVQIRFTDTGIGISDSQLKTLFTFSQRSTYGTSGEKGIGLGLLLCKEYVESNTGQIFVSSKLNVGTTVILEFPAPLRSESELN
jgi:signal transduction histidine kinase